jgi:hypothetical protein
VLDASHSGSRAADAGCNHHIVGNYGIRVREPDAQRTGSVTVSASLRRGPEPAFLRQCRPPTAVNSCRTMEGGRPVQVPFGRVVGGAGGEEPVVEMMNFSLPDPLRWLLARPDELLSLNL